MARRRKTKVEQAVEWEQAERRIWNEFRPKLADLKSYSEGRALLKESPLPDRPGRRFYSNLDFFLTNFVVPAGSNEEERRLYLQFIQRLVAAGEINPGDGDKIEEVLRRAIAGCMG